MKDLDESRMQELLRSHLAGKGHEYIVPNVGLWNWESDLVGVTQAGYAYGYEIKVTRSDFRRDFEKRRHEIFGGTAEVFGRPMENMSERGPSRFFYATPPGLVGFDEVPEHAGLMHVSVGTEGFTKNGRSWSREYARVEEVKAAPRRHGNKLGRDRLRYLARGLGCRFWQLRHQKRRSDDEAA